MRKSDSIMMGKKSEEEACEDMFTAGECRPLISEGEYSVQCMRYNKGKSHPGSLKLFLWFKVFTWSNLDYQPELFMAVNLIDSKTKKPFKKIPPGSKFYKMWTIANFNKPPKRNDRMSPNIFKNNFFKVRVRTAASRNPDGKQMHVCFNYSIVDYLIERETGEK